MENTMLIVDDVEMNREILKLLFHKDYAILEAEDGEEAMAVLEYCQGSIDIVLLDLMMPRMSGFELLEKRKELEYFKNVPVVVITGNGQMNDQIKAFELGANDFIIKPFIPEIVISRVNNVMASYRRMLSIEMEAEKLKIKSELDEMTGLFNKTTAELAIHKLLMSVQKKLSVLLVIDIDNFKTVNDTSGHLAGDHVIKIIADLISSMFRKTDVVGRIGGDEFIVLMDNIPDMNIVYTKVNELIQVMRYKPNLTIPEYVTLSIGVASNHYQTIDYAELFGQADTALYLAKEDGKAGYREYGVEPVNIREDERPAALLIGNNRNVCSTVHALVPPKLRVIEALTLDDLKHVKQKDIEKICIIYADVSECPGEGKEYWDELRKTSWIDFEKVFAICQEGSTDQYRTALMNGVADLLTAPIDHAAFRRRTEKQLEKKTL